MAAKEMYDYLSSATPDYATTTLSVSPQQILVERGNKNIVIHEGDDGSEVRIALDSDSVFYVDLQWNEINESDAGTIYDFFHDTAKGNGIGRTFKWEHPTDGHTYVVRFAGELPRDIKAADRHGIANVSLKVLGYV